MSLVVSSDPLHCQMPSLHRTWADKSYRHIHQTRSDRAAEWVVATTHNTSCISVCAKYYTLSQQIHVDF